MEVRRPLWTRAFSSHLQEGRARAAAAAAPEGGGTGRLGWAGPRRVRGLQDRPACLGLTLASARRELAQTAWTDRRLRRRILCSTTKYVCSQTPAFSMDPRVNNHNTDDTGENIRGLRPAALGASDLAASQSARRSQYLVTGLRAEASGCRGITAPRTRDHASVGLAEGGGG